MALPTRCSSQQLCSLSMISLTHFSVHPSGIDPTIFERRGLGTHLSSQTRMLSPFPTSQRAPFSTVQRAAQILRHMKLRLVPMCVPMISGFEKYFAFSSSRASELPSHFNLQTCFQGCVEGLKVPKTKATLAFSFSQFLFANAVHFPDIVFVPPPAFADE